MQKLFKRFSSLALVLVLVLSLFTVSAAPDAVTVEIFHTNDVHSRVANYALMSAYVNTAREEGNVLLLDAGDTLHGQTFATLTGGESIAAILNAMKYDAMTPGNHDFNYGIDHLFELEKLMDFPLLSANVLKDGKAVFAPSKIFEFGDKKIAVIGVSTPETVYKTHPKNVEGYTFADPVAEVKKAVDAVRGKVDAVVVLSHVGLDESSEVVSSDLAEKIDGIDLIVDGHSHSLLPEGKKVGDTIIASTGEYGANLGKVTLTFNDGKLEVSAALIDIAAQAKLTDADEGYVAPDANIGKIVGDISEELKTIEAKVVGKTDVLLVGEREVVRAGSSNLGNLITAAMLSETGAEIALTNGGGIRASIPVGDITVGNIITVLPFGNYIVTKEISGKDIVAALELGFSAYPETLGGFPHFAGMKVTFDAGKPAGERVVSVKVGDEDIDLEKNYSFATNDFMAAGGDNYVMFGGYPILNEYGALDEAVIKYLQGSGEIPALDDRLVIIPAAEAEPAPEPEPAPASELVPAPKPEPAPAPELAGDTYTVVKGDNLTKIAKKYDTTWKAIYELNKDIIKDPNLIYIGQTLKVK